MRGNFDIFEESDFVSEKLTSESKSSGSGSRERSPKKSNGHVSYYLPLNENGSVSGLFHHYQQGPCTSLENHPCDDSGPVKTDFLRQVSRTLTKTHNSLVRSRLIHIFYIVALPLYTLLGAFIFQFLDGDYDDRAIEEYDTRCQELRHNLSVEINATCAQGDSQRCISLVEESFLKLDLCFREKSYKPFPTHTNSDFINSLIFALSVYTTIGYGNIAAETTGSKIATMLYAIIGIPLFFAFLKDMGQLFSYYFIKGWRWAGRLKNRWLPRKRSAQTVPNLIQATLEATQVPLSSAIPIGKPEMTLPKRKTPKERSLNDKFREQRKVFVWAVFFFLVYLAGVSWLFRQMEETWTYFDSFYFLFTSVALIGFGDVFPKEPRMVLINFAFIVLGIILFGMCYFILQEEIRQKAFQASRRVRNSFFRHRSYRRRSMSLENGRSRAKNGKKSLPGIILSDGRKEEVDEDIAKAKKGRRLSAPAPHFLRLPSPVCSDTSETHSCSSTRV